MESSAIELFRMYQYGATVPELSARTGLPEKLVESHICEIAWRILGNGLDRSFPFGSHRLETFEIQWDLIWDS